MTDYEFMEEARNRIRLAHDIKLDLICHNTVMKEYNHAVEQMTKRFKRKPTKEELLKVHEGFRKISKKKNEYITPFLTEALEKCKKLKIKDYNELLATYSKEDLKTTKNKLLAEKINQCDKKKNAKKREKENLIIPSQREVNIIKFQDRSKQQRESIIWKKNEFDDQDLIEDNREFEFCHRNSDSSDLSHRNNSNVILQKLSNRQILHVKNNSGEQGVEHSICFLEDLNPQEWEPVPKKDSLKLINSALSLEKKSYLSKFKKMKMC